MTMAKIMHLSNAASRQKWAERITAAWGEQLTSIFETGNLLEAAKEELVHGEWGEMCKADLPFDRSTATKLIAIATNDNVRNGAHVRRLPHSWGTLYELTKLTPEQFAAGIKSRAINPRMKRSDVAALRGIEPKERKKKPNDDPEPKTVDDWCLQLSGVVTNAFDMLSEADQAEFLKYLKAVVEIQEEKRK